MKTCVSLGLLVLLLAHSLGWSVAVLYPEQAPQEPRHKVTAASNPSAWQRFAELSEKMLEMDQAQTPPTPLGTILKMLNDITKAYLPVWALSEGSVDHLALKQGSVRFAEMSSRPAGGIVHRTTPPPEMIG